MHHARIERAREGALSRQRREDKYVVSAHEADALEQHVARHLPQTRFGAVSETFVTSIYFDREDDALSRRALATPDDCVKVRVKGYLASDAREEGAAADRLVLELKRRRREQSRKFRLWVPRDLVAALVDGRPSPAGAPRALRLFFALRGAGTLKPVAAITYRRRVYQAGGDLRVTFDRDVAWRPVSASSLAPGGSIAPGALGPVAGGLDAAVVEVKRLRAEMPPWLERVLDGLVPVPGFSKFAEAVRGLGDDAARR